MANRTPLQSTDSAAPRGSVLVVGGGIGGIQTSLDIADQGFKVYLVERGASIGGKMVQLDKTFPTNDCAMCMISPKLVACARHPNIEILTLADVQTVSGGAGRFDVGVRLEPRSVDMEKCTGCGVCMDECPVRCVVQAPAAPAAPAALQADDEAFLGPLVREMTVQEGALLPILQRINARYGSLPRPVLEHTAVRLGLPLAEVLRVATFYHALSVLPTGRHVIDVCRGAACHAMGAGAVVERLEGVLGIKAGGTTPDGLFTLRMVHHIGYCAEAPVIRLDGEPMVRMTPDKAEEIVSRVMHDGGPVPWAPAARPSRDHVGGPPEHRITLRGCGAGERIPRGIDEYLARDGFKALKQTIPLVHPDKVIDAVNRSGLRGRGGAGFPTGRKWAFCRAAKGSPKYLVCNADEGNPGAFMDRVVLENDPFAVIEGMTIGAWAIGARHGYFYVRAEYPGAAGILEDAISAARERGFLGERILGVPFAFDLHVRVGAGAYVCGEETALLASIEGHPGEPRTRPPFPAESGLWGRPTNVNNVKTWATIPQIVLRGADWYAAIGHDRSRGTNAFSLCGHVARPGVYEVPLGTTLRDLIVAHGGGVPAGGRLKAAQTGGPGGGVIPEPMMDLPLDYERLAQAGSAMGSGGIIVLDDATCMVDLARHFLEFSADESCGKCTPCREGTVRMRGILTAICEGRGKPDDLPAMQRLARVMGAASLCGLGQTAAAPLLSILRHFPDEFDAHVRRRRCPAGKCAMTTAGKGGTATTITTTTTTTASGMEAGA